MPSLVFRMSCEVGQPEGGLVCPIYDDGTEIITVSARAVLFF